MGKHYMLVMDDLDEDKLGDYEITPMGRRQASGVLLTRDKQEVLREIMGLLNLIEPIASFIPAPVLSLLVESAADRKIPPDFPHPTIMFVNFIGFPNRLIVPFPVRSRSSHPIFHGLFHSLMQPSNLVGVC